MLERTLQSISVPCWLFSEDLQALICGNTENGVDYDLKDILRSESQVILKRLQNEAVICFGPRDRFMASKNGKGILIQCHDDQDKELVLKADISEELNKVLKEEIAHHHRTQEKLKAHSAKLDAIFNSTALYIWTIGPRGELTSYNAVFKEQMQDWFQREMTIGNVLIEEPIEENIPEWVRFQQTMDRCFEGYKQNIELRLLTLEGEEVWVEIYMDPISDSDTGNVQEISCIGLEITERKRLNDQMAVSLKEKETLLQEVHHRVKNNLQIISSLLNLQTCYVEGGESQEVLKESQNRIKSMSFIHESLYMSNNFSSVDLKDYVNGLCTNLLQSYSTTPEQVRIEMDVDRLTLNIDQAIPCGLIINELVSNALKHAYPDGRSGTFKIRIKEKEGRMIIHVADDGIGIPSDWNLEESESLGIQLVYTLTEQLDGEIEYSGEKGTKYLITFDRI